MVSLKTVALAIVAPTLVFVGVFAYFGTLPQLIQKLSEGVAGAKTFFQPLINGWTNLPSPVKNVIMLGIPTLVTLFFAWTKNRAMTKLQQTEQQAATQTNELTSEINEKAAQVQKLEQQITDLQNTDGTINKLTTKIDSLEQTLHLKEDELLQKTTESNTKDNLIRDLTNKLNERAATL